jgi:hypothetical protein
MVKKEMKINGHGISCSNKEAEICQMAWLVRNLLLLMHSVPKLEINPTYYYGDHERVESGPYQTPTQSPSPHIASNVHVTPWPHYIFPVLSDRTVGSFAPSFSLGSPFPAYISY